VTTRARRRRRATPALLAWALALAGAGLPARAQEWHEHYRNGVRALAQGRVERAIDLLNRAIGLRPEPGVNIVTYGTNVEETYFPYLRLAEAYLAAGRLPAARAALASSERWAREPADERARLRAQLDAAEERQRPRPSPSETPEARATAPPATTPLPAVPSATPVPSAASVASPTPAPATVVTVAPSPRAAAAPARTPPAPASAPSSAPPAPSPPVVAARGELLVTTSPPRSEVYLDDERVGLSDPQSGRLHVSGLAPGRHRLRVTAAGHADHVTELDLAAGRLAPVTIALAPLADEGDLTPYALVALSGLIVAAGVGVFVWLRAGRGARDATLLGRLLTRLGPAPAAPRAHTPGHTPLPEGGEVFGDYHLVEALGRGGMAVVWRAERRGESVALKRPLPQFLDEPEFLERFLREAEIGRTLHHPHIVRILERGDVAGVPYLTMELVPGETLQSWLRRHDEVEPRRAAELVADVAEALDYAHLKGVIHRDLKPSNIMVLPDGSAKVMDYGIARARRFDGLTATGAFLGTPDYVAPEIIEGRGSQARSDLYALGVVFYELLTGRRPFVADTPFGLLRQHCTEVPRPPSELRPDLPPEIDALVARLLAKDPDERGDAEALLVTLRDWLNRAA
jgi:hypothetical protein